MRLFELVELLECEAVCGSELLHDRTVEECFAADLMSDVLAFSRPGALLVTGLVNPQSAHTADVAEMAAVLFVSGKQPSEPVIVLATEKGIPLLTTPLSMFEACGRLYRAGLTPAARRPGDA